MRSLLLVMVAGCTSTETYRVTWELRDVNAATPPTCGSYSLLDISIFLHDGDVTGRENFPCALGEAEIEAAGGHTYDIDVTAVGVMGDNAGSGTVTSAPRDVTVVVDVLPTVSMPHATWTLQTATGVAPCSQFPNAAISVATSPATAGSTGGGVIDIWDCDEANAITETPYGPFTTAAALFDTTNPNPPLGTSSTVLAGPQRGEFEVPLTIDVN